MAIVKTRVCDRDECKQENAIPCQTFSDRRMDGAGSMENWYYTFDLCPECCGALLDRCLDKLGPDEAKKLLVAGHIHATEG